MFRPGHNQPGKGVGGDVVALGFGLGTMTGLLALVQGKIFKARQRATTYAASIRKVVWQADQRSTAWRGK